MIVQVPGVVLPGHGGPPMIVVPSVGIGESCAPATLPARSNRRQIAGTCHLQRVFDPNNSTAKPSVGFIVAVVPIIVTPRFCSPEEVPLRGASRPALNPYAVCFVLPSRVALMLN